MKKKLTKNLPLKLLSLALAVFLWAVVVNVDDPVTSVQFSNVPVEVLHPEVVTSKGKTYQIEDETDTVRVTVRAKRSVLHSMTVSDIKASADMKEMSLGSQVPIEVSIPGFEYVEAYSSPRNLQERSRMKHRIHSRLRRQQQEASEMDTCWEKLKQIRRK